jgi:peptidoglycan/LPS O-acetylase OafA/YrhL
MLATHVAIRIADRIPGLTTPGFVLMAVFIAIAIASCSYYFVERPFLAMKTKPSGEVSRSDTHHVSPHRYTESKPSAPLVT